MLCVCVSFFCRVLCVVVGVTLQYLPIPHTFGITHGVSESKYDTSLSLSLSFSVWLFLALTCDVSVSLSFPEHLCVRVSVRVCVRVRARARACVCVEFRPSVLICSGLLFRREHSSGSLVGDRAGVTSFETI